MNTQDTPITELRNIIGPLHTYMQMMKMHETFTPELIKIRDEAFELAVENHDRIIEIIKQIPDNAIHQSEFAEEDEDRAENMAGDADDYDY